MAKVKLALCIAGDDHELVTISKMEIKWSEEAAAAALKLHGSNLVEDIFASAVVQFAADMDDEHVYLAEKMFKRYFADPKNFEGEVPF